MTVRCPRCGTLYRRPGRLRREPETTFRCARCRHVFALDDDERAPTADEPSFEDDEQFSFADEDDDDEPAVETAPPPPQPPSPRAEPTPADEDRTAATGMSATFRFALRAVLAVTLGYGVLSIYLFTHPEVGRSFLAGVPVLGRRLVETRLHPASIQLSGVRGTFQRVKGDRTVFVIAGTAVNSASLPTRAIQVEGRAMGTHEERQVVYCGVAPRDLRDLSMREIALLQNLEPPKDWSLGPGEQADFLIVFADPPPDLREFAVEVVSVQAPLRRRAAPEPVATSLR